LSNIQRTSLVVEDSSCSRSLVSLDSSWASTRSVMSPELTTYPSMRSSVRFDILLSSHTHEPSPARKRCSTDPSAKVSASMIRSKHSLASPTSSGW
jgi:hypothetical protein